MPQLPALLLALATQATVLLSLGTLALWTFRHRSASLRHGICLAALVGVLLLPAFGLLPVPSPVAPTVGGWTMTTSASGPTHGVSYTTVAAYLWLIGVGVSLLRVAGGWLYLWTLTRRSRHLAPRLVESDAIRTPLAWGVFRPVVLLPAEAGQWSPRHREIALLHEETHITRRDPASLLLAQFATALYWFHPLVWWFAACLRQEQEAACDDALLHAGIAPAEYAEALVETARGSYASPAVACAMASSPLRDRLHRLFARRDRRPLTRRSSAVMMMVVALLALGFAPHLLPPAHGQTPKKLYRIGENVAPPKLIYKVEPQYTDEAKEAKIAGTTLLSVEVWTDGQAHDIQVERSLDPGLDQKAIEAVQQWRFQPATKDGDPVNVAAHIEVHFKLR